MAFKVTVNNSIELDLIEDDISKLDVIQTLEKQYHILQNNKSYKVDITGSDFNKKLYQISINSNNYSVSIATDLDLLIMEMGFSLGSTKHVKSIKAPMPGLILDINVKLGQEVKEDDPLLVLEAMKMENIIMSPRNGKVKSISVAKGDAIEKGELLIEFEE